MATAPRAFNRDIFMNREQVYYGTDDGSKDGSFSEYPAIEKHYENVDQNRKDNIHMISVIGGLYCLNLIPVWKPKKMTFFDINPMAIKYFKIILNVWTTSDSADHFLNRLTEGDFVAETEDDIFIKENISIIQKTGDIPAHRGASSNRTLAASWRKALESFETTKKYLIESEIVIRTEPMEGENFKNMIKTESHHWIYASNITQFHFFELEILEPSNVVVLQIDREESQLVDLAEYSGSPVKVKFEIPITVEKI